MKMCFDYHIACSVVLLCNTIHKVIAAVGCRHDAVQCDTKFQRSDSDININQNWNPQIHPIPCPSGQAIGVPMVRILDEIDRVITTPQMYFV